MKTVTITAEEETEILAVIRTLKQVVEEAGEDYIYKPKFSGSYQDEAGYSHVSPPSCVYVWDGKPDCIAARVLHKLGMSLERLRCFESSTCAQMIGQVGVPIHEAALIVLGIAQHVQDTGTSVLFVEQSPEVTKSFTWGVARDAAIKYANTEYGVRA